MEEICISVVPYIGTWIETTLVISISLQWIVVPYIGTWIETAAERLTLASVSVVPYIGTWIETSSTGVEDVE